MSTNIIHTIYSIVSWKWGFWHPTFHLFFEILGYATSFYFYKTQDVLDVLTPVQRKNLKWWTLGGAIIGAKLVPILEVISQPYGWLAFFSGKSLAGGLLGGIVGSEWGKKRLGILASTGDVLTLPLLWGALVGRIGCACSAVFDGMLGQPIPYTGRIFNYLGVFIPPPSEASASLFRLYQWQAGYYWNMGTLEILGLLVIMVFIYSFKKYARTYFRTGGLFYMFCFLYFGLRLILDIFKNGLVGLSVVQGVSMIGVVYALFTLCQLFNKQGSVHFMDETLQ